MIFFYLLLGILLAATLFVSVLWSLAQCFQTSGTLRRTYLMLAVMTIAGMLALTFELSVMPQVCGAVLVYFAAAAVFAEQGSSRLLPLVQLVFGALLVTGLPLSYLPA